MTSATAPGSEPDDVRLHEALQLASVPPSDDVGPETWPGEAGWDIATTAAHLGGSAHTLRYYERIGLVRVGRDAFGHRRYDAVALRRLVFLTRMRTSGMPIRDLRRYVDMVEAGRDTVPDRLAILTEHRDDLRVRIDGLQLALAATEYKIAVYTRQLEERATTDGVGNVNDIDGGAAGDNHSSPDSDVAAGTHGTTLSARRPRDSNGRHITSRVKTPDRHHQLPTHSYRQTDKENPHDH